MSDMLDRDQSAETPFTDLMARIPKDATLGWYEQHGLGKYCHAPVGAYVHRALIEIERLRAIEALHADLVASRAAEIESLFTYHATLRGNLPIDLDNALAEIDRLRTENAKLRAQIGRYSDMLTLFAENERLRADAERYRWLRRQHWDEGGLCVVENGRKLPLGIQCASFERLDDAIDAALRGEKP